MLQRPVQAPFRTTLQCHVLTGPFFLLVSYITLHTCPLHLSLVVSKTYFLYGLLTILFKTVYNIFFRHRGIPGSYWFTATDWALWKEYRKGSPHRAIEAQHEKYGDIVRIQPNHISFSSLAAVEEIHGPRTKTLKSDAYPGIFGAPDGPRSVFTLTSDKKRHEFVRKIHNTAFNTASLKQLDPVIHRYMNNFIDCIRKAAERNDGVVEMTHWFSNQLFAVVGELAIGSDFGALDFDKQIAGERHFFPEAATKYFLLVQFFWAIPWLMEGFRLLPTPKWILEMRLKTVIFVSDSISQTLEKEHLSGEKRTLLGLMSKAVDPESGETLSRRELSANAVNILYLLSLIIGIKTRFAGVDTTSTGVTFTLYHLLSRRSTWDQLSAEVRCKFKSQEDITSNDISTLPYLDAVVHEGLRLCNPIPSFLPRITPPQGMTISGKNIPGNTIVSTSYWRIMHDPTNFSNPYQFLPERWIKGHEAGETCNKAAWLPFSTGLRGCNGKPLAMLEIKLALAMFIWHFEARFKVEGQAEPEFIDSFGVRRGKLEIVVTPVQR